MKGDYSRFSFDKKKHYSAVLMQQGRLQLDSDWNEQVQISEHRNTALFRDLVGRSGTPKGNAMTLELKDKTTLTLTRGVCYIDGLFLENDEVLELKKDALAEGDGDFLVYLDAWTREVDAAEDSELVDPAIELDTTTRLKTEWKLCPKRIPAGVAGAWKTTFQAGRWPEVLSNKNLPAGLSGADWWWPVSTGKMTLTFGTLKVKDNRLYRVEIHEVTKEIHEVTKQPDGTARVQLKWSRDNAFVCAEVKPEEGDEGAYKLAKDSLNLREAFKDAAYIELCTPEAAGLLLDMRKAQFEEGVLVLGEAYAEAWEKLKRTGKLLIRRWDGVFENGEKKNSLEEELGLTLAFEEEEGGFYRSGDYWQLLIREKEVLNWTSGTSKAPEGVTHHFAALAIVKVSGGVVEAPDILHIQFNPLTSPNLSTDSDLDVRSLTVQLESILKGNTTVGTTAANKTLTVHGTATVSGNTTVGGALTVNGTGASTMKGSLGVTGALTASSTASITGNTTVGGTLTVNGTGASKIGGPLTVTGALTASSTVGITGDTTVGGALTVNGTGASKIGGALTVVGALTAANISGNTTVGGALTVNSTANITGATTLGGNLQGTSGSFSTPANPMELLTLGVTPQSLAFDSGVADTKTVEVFSKTSWTATSNATAWCTVTASGTGNAKPTVTVTENSTASARTATVTFTSAGCSRTVNVTQPALLAPNIGGFIPSQAQHSTALSILGANFSSTPAKNVVNLNGYAATVTAATPTQLTVTVPKNMSCSGNITVTVGSKTTTAAARFSYVPSGVVSRIAGSDTSTSGLVDGAGPTVALFKNPRGIAIDSLGNFYVADSGNHCIRQITPAGVVSRFAGSASGTAGSADGAGLTVAQFNGPYGIAIDADNNLYVVEYSGRRIRKVTPSRVVSTLAGSNNNEVGDTNATGTAARFCNPSGIVIDIANSVLYVADTDNHRIRKVTFPGGVVTTLAGSTAGFADGVGTGAQFYGPRCIARDTSGNLFVTDTLNHRIRKVTTGGVVSTLAGSTSGFADGAGAVAQFFSPYGIAADASNNLYVADYSNHRIRRVTPQGLVSTIAGNGSVTFVDGTGSTAQFYNPYGIVRDSSGTLYVTELNGNRVRKIVLE